MNSVRTILLVDDSPTELALMKHALRGNKYKLITASNGEEALETLSRLKPDLILLDVNLPDIPGHEVLAQLRADPRTSDIPVLVISADATSIQMQRMLETGARAYLTKPLDVKRFLSVLDEGLSQAV